MRRTSAISGKNNGMDCSAPGIELPVDSTVKVVPVVD